LCVRKASKALRNSNFRSILSARHFRVVVSAVKDVAGYNARDNTYQHPSVAIELGRDIKKSAVVLKNIALKEGNQHAAKDAKNFLELCEGEWNDEVSGGARRLIQRRKANKIHVLPLASDVHKLNVHLQDTKESSMACVSKGVGNENFSAAFRDLGSSVLSQLLLFNRRRQGEVSKLKIETYVQNCIKKYLCQDAIQSLSSLEKNLLSSFTRIEVPGKRDRIVPILITSEQKIALDMLVNTQLRSSAGIAQNNPYVFAATMGSLRHIRGNDVLRSFAQECGAQNPLHLKTTALRKHVATLSQVINLKNHEMDQLAAFMGHNIRIHREHYRLPVDVIQTAKVARILLAMENGSVSKYSGMSLEDIDLNASDGELRILIYGLYNTFIRNALQYLA